MTIQWDNYWQKLRWRVSEEIRNCEHRQDVKIFEKYLMDCNVILEAGCGIGSVCRYLSMKTRGIVVGCDISLVGLRMAMAERSENTQYLRADVRRLPFRDKSFDAVLSLGVIEHMEDPTEPVAEIGRVLKGGGITFISTPNAYCYHHRITRFIKSRLGVWQLGTERSFTANHLTCLLRNQTLHPIQIGYFYWGKKPLNRIFKKYFERILKRFGSMAYVLAEKPLIP